MVHRHASALSIGIVSSALMGCAAGPLEEGQDIALVSEGGKFDQVDGVEYRLIETGFNIWDSERRGLGPIPEELEMSVWDAGDKLAVAVETFTLPELRYNRETQEHYVFREGEVHKAADVVYGVNVQTAGCDACGQPELGFVLRASFSNPRHGEILTCATSATRQNVFTSMLIDPRERELTIDGQTFAFEECGLEPNLSLPDWELYYFELLPVPLAGAENVADTHRYSIHWEEICGLELDGMC